MKFSIALNSIQSSGKEVHIFPWNHFLFWLKSVLESINQRLWFCAEHNFGRLSAKTLKNICGLSVKLKGLRGNPLPLLWSFLLLVVSKYVLWQELSGHWFGLHVWAKYVPPYNIPCLIIFSWFVNGYHTVDSFHSAVRSELGMFGEDCTAFYSIYYYSENDAVCACIQQTWRMLRRDEWKIIFTVQSMILYQEYPDNLFSWTLNDIPIVTSGESTVTRKLTGLGT